MSFHLTINKPAADRYFDAKGLQGLGLRVANGEVQITGATDARAPGCFPFQERTRGGLEISVWGDIADQVLSLGYGRDDYMVLTGEVGDGWVSTERFVRSSTADKPHKAKPSARIWRVKSSLDAVALPDFDFEHETVSDVLHLFVSRFSVSPDAEQTTLAELVKLSHWCTTAFGREGDRWKVEGKATKTESFVVSKARYLATPEAVDFEVRVTIPNKEDAAQFKLTFC